LNGTQPLGDNLALNLRPLGHEGPGRSQITVFQVLSKLGNQIIEIDFVPLKEECPIDHQRDADKAQQY
jgi:hypothetical protein